MIIGSSLIKNSPCLLNVIIRKVVFFLFQLNPTTSLRINDAAQPLEMSTSYITFKYKFVQYLLVSYYGGHC